MIIYRKKLHFPVYILFFFILCGFLHLAGGNFYFNGTRLYDIFLINHLLRFDNLMHFFGSFIYSFLIYNFLRPHLDLKVKQNPFFLSTIIILVAVGIGSLNESLEFSAASMGFAPGVGGCINTSLDLIYNTIGAVIASIFIVRYHRKLSHLK